MAHKGRNGLHEDGFPANPHFFDGYNNPQAFDPQTGVLDQTDMSMMQNFFDNPDTASTSENLFAFGGFALSAGAGASIDHKTNSAFGYTLSGVGNNNGTVNGTAHDIGGLPTGFDHPNAARRSRQPQFDNSNMTMMFADQHSLGQQPPGDTMEGASALLGLSSSQHQDQSNAMGRPGANFTSWGNFGMGNLGVSTNDVSQSPLMAPGRQSNTAFNPHAGSTHISAQHYSQQFSPLQPTSRANPLQQQQHSQSAGPRMTRHHSLQHIPTTQNYFNAPVNQQQPWQMPQPPYRLQNGTPGARQTAIRFGSDNDFGDRGYQGPDHTRSDETTVKLVTGIFEDPAVQAAASQGRGQMQGYRPSGEQPVYQRHSVPDLLQHATSAASSPGVYPTVPPYSPMAGAQHTPAWNKISAPRNQNTQQSKTVPRSHKRRISELESNDYASQSLSQSIEQGNTSRRAGPFPKQEPSDEQDQNIHYTPPTNKRRKSNNAIIDNTSSHSASPSDNVGTSSTPQPSSASARKRRSEPKQPRINLSDTQKRNNHIASEQKRRDAMKTNFDDLNRMVPTLQSGGSGLSRSDVLQHAAIFLETLQQGNAIVRGFLSKKGINCDDSGGEEEDVHGNR